MSEALDAASRLLDTATIRALNLAAILSDIERGDRYQHGAAAMALGDIRALIFNARAELRVADAKPSPAPAARPWPTLQFTGPCMWHPGKTEDYTVVPVLAEAAFRELLRLEGSEGILRRILAIRDEEAKS